MATHRKDPHWKSSWKTVSCGRDLTHTQGKSEEEEAAETCELNTTPILCLLTLLEGKAEEL